MKKTVDMRCANCGHPPESHHASRGQCYQCPAEARCPEWVPRDEEAQLVIADQRRYEEG